MVADFGIFCRNHGTVCLCGPCAHSLALLCPFLACAQLARKCMLVRVRSRLALALIAWKPFHLRRSNHLGPGLVGGRALLYVSLATS